jgi:hypothetical protein
MMGWIIFAILIILIGLGFSSGFFAAVYNRYFKVETKRKGKSKSSEDINYYSFNVTAWDRILRKISRWILSPKMILTFFILMILWPIISSFLFISKDVSSINIPKAQEGVAYPIVLASGVMSYFPWIAILVFGIITWNIFRNYGIL